MKTKTTTTYVCDDGKEFDNKRDAHKHDISLFIRSHLPKDTARMTVDDVISVMVDCPKELIEKLPWKNEAA